MRLTFTLVLDEKGDVVWTGSGHWPQGEMLEDAREFGDALREFWVTITGTMDDPQTEIMEL